MNQSSPFLWNTFEQHRTLMLCHVVPGESGNVPRRRAWAVLEAAAHGGRVSLACIHDGPVNLEQWRELDQLADRVSIESASPMARWLGATLRPLNRRGLADRWTLVQPLAATVHAWQCERAFDQIIVTHPAIARHLPLAAPVHLCTLDGESAPWFLSHPADAEPLARAA